MRFNLTYITNDENDNSFEFFIQNKKITGLCPPNGGALQQGKIAE